MVKEHTITLERLQKVMKMIVQLVLYLTILISKHYKKIAINLSRQKTLDVDPKTIKEINFTGNPEQNAATFSVIEEARRTVLDF